MVSKQNKSGIRLFLFLFERNMFVNLCNELISVAIIYFIKRQNVKTNYEHFYLDILKRIKKKIVSRLQARLDNNDGEKSSIRKKQ